MLFTELKQSLKDGVASAYWAQGSDVFLVNKSVELILGVAGKTPDPCGSPPLGKGEATLVRFDEDVKPDAIGAALGNVSMFGERTVVVVRGADFAKVYLKPIKSDKEFTKIECNPMPEGVVVKLIMQNKKFGAESAGALCKMCECNYANVANEMAKLEAFYTDKAAISVADIEAIVTKTEKYQVYELSNALLKRDRARVGAIIESLDQHGVDAYAVFGSLVAFCRRLFYACCSKAEAGVIASVLGCNPYAIIATRREGNWLSVSSQNHILKVDFAPTPKAPTPRAIYERALDLEWQIKSGRIAAERATVLLAGLFL